MLDDANCAKDSEVTYAEHTVPSCLTTTNSKVGKLIRDLQDNVTHKGIILLLLEIAERPEVCVNFDIDLRSYLNMFLHCEEDVVLTEASHLILSAAKIYSRRVDYVHECIQQIISGMDRSIKAAEDRKRMSPNKQKRAMKRPRMEQDSLYEAEIIPKQLKRMSPTKTTEVLSPLSTFEAPRNFFRQWKKYKEWRAQYKRKMKCPIPYSTLHDTATLHPSLWKLSCIEDFDYEDDIDTKRNYKVFTNYIEHRHSTLVNDINFIMHFKVKDFIEAEEDEIEIMNILGLPPPPKRKWPPFCKTFGIEEKHSETSTEDYINNYLELENALLESEHCHYIRKSKQIGSPELMNTGVKCNLDKIPSESLENQVNLIREENQSELCNDIHITNVQNSNDFILSGDVTLDNNNCQTTFESITNFAESIHGQESMKEQNRQIPVNEKNETSHSSKDASLSNVENVSIIANRNQSTTENSRCENLDDSRVSINETIQDTTPKSVNNEEIGIVQGLGVESMDPARVQITDTQKSSVCGSSVDTEKGDNLSAAEKTLDDNIIIRLSVDEGVALSDLDEIDRAMLSPVVELVDILKPIISKVPSPTDLVFHDDRTHNFLELDQALLTFKQDFTLPLEVILQKQEIKRNILAIPEHILRKPSFFKLPQDFNAFKKDRNKRKKELSNADSKLKLHKLNDGTIKSNLLTPPPSPPISEDFFGFGDSLLCDNTGAIIEKHCEPNENSEQFQEEAAGAKTSRSFSRDSGIGISATDNIYNAVSESLYVGNDTDNVLNTLNLSQFQNENNFYLENPIFHSTIINSDGCSSTLNNIEYPSNTSGNLSSSENSGGAPQLIEEMPSDCVNSRRDSTLHEHSKVNEGIVDLNVIIEKVQRWHRYLKPILHQSKERHHFDVFAIGTEIINKFSETEQKSSSITFEDVVKEKEPSYISRYFLSSLLLANQNNISLQVLDTNKEEPVPLNKIQLTLESEKRHSISIEDDIGATLETRKRLGVTNNKKEVQSKISLNNLTNKSSEAPMKEEQLFVKRNDEKIYEILRKYRETNREFLIKEIEENRDDYIRILSQKHDIDLGLYFTENEIHRLKTENVRRNFENECLIYPKNINIRQNKAKNRDDADSGFHSSNTTELDSAIL